MLPIIAIPFGAWSQTHKWWQGVGNPQRFLPPFPPLLPPCVLPNKEQNVARKKCTGWNERNIKLRDKGKKMCKWAWNMQWSNSYESHGTRAHTCTQKVFSLWKPTKQHNHTHKNVHQKRATGIPTKTWPSFLWYPWHLSYSPNLPRVVSDSTIHLKNQGTHSKYSIPPSIVSLCLAKFVESVRESVGWAPQRQTWKEQYKM